jgi:hypothetical protein
MPNTSLLHAALSAAAVGLLLATLRRAGPRAAGLAAAVPINSLPALFWLFVERGGGYAMHAVLGSLWGTGLTVLLGASFARAALVVHAGWAAAFAWLATAALAIATWQLAALPAVAALLALAAVVVGRAATPPAPAQDGERRGSGRDATLVAMATAGAMSLLVTELSRRSAPQFCGLVAAIPVIGMFATCAGYRQGGAPRMLRVLGGYLDGMAAKAAFLAGLGAAWAAGAGASAWAIAVFAAATTLVLQQRVTRAASAAPAPSASPTRSTACRPSKSSSSSSCSSSSRASSFERSGVPPRPRLRALRREPPVLRLPSSWAAATWRDRRTR